MIQNGNLLGVDGAYSFERQSYIANISTSNKYLCSRSIYIYTHKYSFGNIKIQKNGEKNKLATMIYYSLG
jgi:hypothetical protein